MPQPVAVIDLGTNTARLLIGSLTDEGKICPILLKRHITRLGGGFSETEGISAEARERTVAALRDFAEDIARHGVDRVRAVATSAVRDAANREAFCSEIRELTGIELDVIDGTTEGVLTLSGVLAGIDVLSPYTFVFDVGGGSTEYTLAEGKHILFTESLPLGVVRLTEGKITVEAMEEKINRELGLLKEKLDSACLSGLLRRSTLIGTAGTATTLAAVSMQMVDYDYRKVNNYIIPLEEVRQIFARLLPLSPEQRLGVSGLEKGREDLIIAGICITLKTMEAFGFRELKVSDFGILEGLLLDL